MPLAPAHVSHATHDLSPSAVHEQVILPARIRYFVITLEAIFMVCLFTAGFFIFKGGIEERRLVVLHAQKQELESERDRLQAELRQRQADHRKATTEAAWIRRNMPMQPMILEILNSITANVTLHDVEAEMAEGGAPQLTVKVQLMGTPEAIERAMTQINEAFYHMNMRVLAPPIPQRNSQYTEVTFPVQYPSVDEISFSSKNG